MPNASVSTAPNKTAPNQAAPNKTITNQTARNPAALSDHDLVFQTDRLVNKEREVLVEILQHLREIERRRLFSDYGFRSLFDMAVKHFGYSEDQAYRRIAAMRLLKELPELQAKISDGSLNLSHIGITTRLFRAQAQISDTMAREQKLEFCSQVASQPIRMAEKIAQSYASCPEVLRPDKILTISQNKIELRFLADATVQQKLEILRGRLAHRSPSLTLGDLVHKICDLALEVTNPSLSDEYQQFSFAKKPAKIRQVFARDKNQCTNCGSTFALELDHIQPRSKGGTNHPSNLRVLCRSCNQRAAITKLGQTTMDQYLN